MLFAWCFASGLPIAAQVVVGAGSSVDLGTGTLAAGCGDLQVAGAMNLAQGQMQGVRALSIAAGGLLDGGSGSLSWSGDWTDLGQFQPGTSSASWVDGCGVSTATANAVDEQFHALALSTATGRELRFTSGQTTTVSAAFSATGTPGNRLRIRGTTAGAAAFLALPPGATQSLSAVDVEGNHATGQPLGFPGPAADYGSIKGSNSAGWFELAPSLVEIPTVSTLGVALLACALAVAAWRRLASPGANGDFSRRS
jgi:hypothetical protein